MAKEPVVKPGQPMAKNVYPGTCATCHGRHGESYALLKTLNLRILDAADLER